MEADKKEADPVAICANHAQEEPVTNADVAAAGQMLKTDEAAATSTAGKSTSSDAADGGSGQKVNEGLTAEQAHGKVPDLSDDASAERVRTSVDTEQAESAEQHCSTVKIPNGETKQADISTEQIQSTSGIDQSSRPIQDPINDESKSPDQPCTTGVEQHPAEEEKQSTKVEQVQSTEMPTSDQPCPAAAAPNIADEVKLSATSSEQVQTTVNAEQPTTTESADQPRQADEEPQTAGEESDTTADTAKPPDTAASAVSRDGDASPTETQEEEQPQPQQPDSTAEPDEVLHKTAAVFAIIHILQ